MKPKILIAILHTLSKSAVVAAAAIVGVKVCHGQTFVLPAGTTSGKEYIGFAAPYAHRTVLEVVTNSTLANSSVRTTAYGGHAIEIDRGASLTLDASNVAAGDPSGAPANGGATWMWADSRLSVLNGSVVQGSFGIVMGAGSTVQIDASTVRAYWGQTISMGHDNGTLTISNGSQIYGGEFNDQAILVTGLDHKIEISDSTVNGRLAVLPANVPSTTGRSSIKIVRSVFNGDIGFGGPKGASSLTVANSELTGGITSYGENSVMIADTKMNGAIAHQSTSALNLAVSKSIVVGPLVSSTGPINATFTNGSEFRGYASGNVNLTLRDSSVWSGHALSVSKIPTVSIDETSTWNIPATAFSLTVGSLDFAGRINMAAARSGSRILTIGNLVGKSGTIAMNTYFGADDSPTDLLRIQQGASGTTHLSFSNMGGTGGPTKTGIKVVDYVDSATAKSAAFDMPSGPVDVGLFRYTLQQLDDGDYYLTSAIMPAARLPAVTLYVSQDNAQRAVYSFLERPRGRLWVAGHGANTWNDTRDGLQTQVRSQGVLAGGEIGRWHAVEFSAFTAVDRSAILGDEGRIDLTTAGIGGNAHLGGRHGYLEIAWMATHLRHHTRILGDSLRSEGLNLLASVSAGRQFRWRSVLITPHLQASMQEGVMRAAQGDTLRSRYDTARIHTLKAAAKVEYSFRRGARLWLKAGFMDRANAATSVRLTHGQSEPLAAWSDMTGHSAEIDAGCDFALSRRVSFFSTVAYEHGKHSHGLRGGIGIRGEFR